MVIVGTSISHKSDHISLDIDKLAKSMREEMKNLPPFSGECCIYRVPIRLRELDENSFTPRVVSIGPLHHGKEGLEAMEEHKILYLQDFIERSKVSMEDLIKVVGKSESRLRHCYAETIKLSSEEFVKMILLDAAFVIMVLLKDSSEKFEGSSARNFGMPWMLRNVKLDMILLENQLPFFILEKLLKAADIAPSSPSGEKCSMIRIAYEYFKDRWECWLTEGILEKVDPSEVAHFVDFMARCQEPSEPRNPKELETMKIPSVTELRQAGVKFKSRSGKRLLDLKFDQGILEIPSLKIKDYTKILFRNLQAFEQCHGREGYIGNYISMINFLVISSKDVEILVRKGIIENWIHDNEAVSDVLHNISQENVLSPKDFIYASLTEDLNAYYKRPWNKWKATLKQDYFNNPWAIISLIAAVILLVLTVIQTVCSALQL